MTYHSLEWQSHGFDRYLFKMMVLGNEQSCSLEVIITNCTFGQKNINFGFPLRKLSRGCFATTSVFIEKLLKTWVRKSIEKITIAKSFYKLNPNIILYLIHQGCVQITFPSSIEEQQNSMESLKAICA